MRLLHIGRATTNDIVVADTTVSRQHAQLMIDDIGQATLIDLGSSNGSFVNGRRISSPTRLDPTDIVKVGEYLLPWRKYLQETPHTPASEPINVAPVEDVHVSPSAPDMESTAFKRKLWMALGGGGVMVLIIAIVILIFGGSSKPDFVGKWHDKEVKDAWIKFEKDGTYSEGLKTAVIYEDATWKAMGIDRLLIEKGQIEVSKRYEFVGKNLLLTQNGKTTTYERE